MAATGTPTPNLGLRIPVGTDPASVDDINYNSNLLDTKLGAIGNDSVQDQITTLNNNLKIKKQDLTLTTNSDGYADTGISSAVHAISVHTGSYPSSLLSYNSKWYVFLFKPSSGNVVPVANDTRTFTIEYVDY